ncbi:MAG: NADPH-dependent oxidoreductase [Bacteroidetes bacterium]|nr:NADPH-dependent oxidoreductase [Bacteroidota bacterium]
MKAAIISGSSREGNNTLRVANAMKNLILEEGYSAEVIDFREYDIPFFNGYELDINNLTPFQEKLISAWDQSDLIILISPEYNWFPSAELVNMIHQVGNHDFAHLFDKKVFAFAGVSSGRGGRLPGIQMSSVFDKLISHLHKVSVCSPSKYESHYSPDELSEDGEFVLNTPYRKHMKKFVRYNLDLTLKFQ